MVSIPKYYLYLGFISVRDREQGSIFIQALCKELNKNWYVTDINTIAADVNKRIMKSYGRIQAPVFENQLGRLVYFSGNASI